MEEEEEEIRVENSPAALVAVTIYPDPAADTGDEQHPPATPDDLPPSQPPTETIQPGDEQNPPASSSVEVASLQPETETLPRQEQRPTEPGKSLKSCGLTILPVTY